MARRLVIPLCPAKDHFSSSSLASNKFPARFGDAPSKTAIPVFPNYPSSKDYNSVESSSGLIINPVFCPLPPIIETDIVSLWG
jgi:hypothetical protein